MDPMELMTLIGWLGQAGQGMLKGTDKEWVAAPGAAAAGIAKNIQAGNANKEFIDTLRGIIPNINNPNVSGVNFTLDPQTGKLTGSLKGTAQDPGMPDWTRAQLAPGTPVQAPPSAATPAETSVTKQAVATHIGNMLANPNPNFRWAQLLSH